MKIVILAGGEGTRLYPITYEIPKPLITIKKKPVIDYVIDFLAHYGFSEIGVIINAKHKIDFDLWEEKRIGSGMIHLFVEDKPAGTFGCLRLVKNWINNESFVVANGDCLVDCNFDEVIEFHNAHRPVVTAPLLKVNTSGNYGIYVMDGIYVKQFLRKEIVAGNEFIGGGPYICEPTIFDYDEPMKEFLNIEADIFPKLIKNKQIIAILEKKSRFFDCGTLENWGKAIKEW